MDNTVPDTPAALPPVTPPGTTRWVKIALVASLAVNLAMLGVVGGAVVHDARQGGRPMARDLGFGPFTDALSPEDRAALGNAFRRDGGKPHELRRELRAEYGQLLTALRADPFDEAKLRGVFDLLHARGRDRLELGQRLLSDRVLAMSPEARQQFADRLEDIVSRGPKRKLPNAAGD